MAATAVAVAADQPRQTAAPPPHPPRPRLLAVAWRWVKAVVVFAIVVLHLLLFLIRNPLDVAYKPIRAQLEKNTAWWKEYGEAFKRTDRVTEKYLNLVGCEQGWSMFTPPMARKAPFLGYRLDFTDGTTAEIHSSREPADPSAFFRFGDWQVRKYEDYLSYPPDNLADDAERPLWEAAARRTLARWKAEHPDDPRTIRRVVMLRYTIHFPGPDEAPGAYLPAEKPEVARFDAEGSLIP